MISQSDDPRRVAYRSGRLRRSRSRSPLLLPRPASRSRGNEGRRRTVRVREANQRRERHDHAPTLRYRARRHQWELEARGLTAAERDEAEEQARSANFAIRFAYRDSAHTWARILATNRGEATARNVRLDVRGERDGGREEIEHLGGTDYRNANRLQAGESVHVAVVFTLASPQPEDLRYRVSWEDDRGEQEIEGRVPLD